MTAQFCFYSRDKKNKNTADLLQWHYMQRFSHFNFRALHPNNF